MVKNDSLHKKQIIKLLPKCVLIIATLLSAVSVLYYTAFLSKNFVNTDIFDTLIWAKASYESGRIISSDFNYSAILPFGGSLLMLPFIEFFGISFTTHAVGMVLFVIIFLCSLSLFFKRIGLNTNWIMLSLIATCALWLCSDKLREMFMEHIIYYSLSALFILIGYCLLDSLIKAIREGLKNKKTILLAAITFIFFLFVGTDGFQIVGLATVPVICGFAFERFFDIKTKLFSKDNRSEIIALAVVCAATLIGMVLIKILLKGNSSYYADANSQYDTNDGIYNFAGKTKMFIACWYQLFEVFFISKISLSSIAQIPVLLSAAYATVLLLVIPVTAIFYRKIKDRNVKRIFWISFTVMLITVVLWLVSSLYGVNWRLIPAVFASFILLIADLKLLTEKTQLRRFGVILIALCLFPIIPNTNYLLAYSPESDSGNYEKIEQKMDEYKITKGYGNYWEVGTLNVMSAERISGTFAAFDSDCKQLCIYNYQQFPFDENEDSSDKTYLILNSEEAKIYEKTAVYKKYKGNLLGTYEYTSGSKYKLYFYDFDIYGEIIHNSADKNIVKQESPD